MQIITELEPHARGPYTGSLGYIRFAGELDWNIIIRTLWVRGGRAWGAGGSGDCV